MTRPQTIEALMTDVSWAKRSPANRLSVLMQKLAVPMSVTFEVNKRCNLKCTHCYVEHNNAERFTTDIVKRTLDEIAEMGTLYLSLTGGEVGLRKDLVELVAHARQVCKFETKLLTSGTLFGDSEMDALAEAGLRRVHLSVYSHRAEVHDLITQVPGSFERTMYAVRGFVARGMNVRMQSPMMQENARELAELADLATDVGAEYQFDPHISGHESGTQEHFGHALGIEEYRELLGEPDFRRAIGFDGAVDAVRRKAPRWTPEGHSVCGAGRSVAFVDAGGHVLPCSTWRQPLGDLLEQSFGEIWAKSPSVRWIRGLGGKDLQTGDLDASGGMYHHCYGRSESETGDPLKAAPSHRALDVAGFEAATALAAREDGA